jgi:hypothetical protein
MVRKKNNNSLASRLRAIADELDARDPDSPPATELLPPGRYQAVIIDAESRIAQNSRRPYWRLTFGDIQGYPNHKLWYTSVVRYPQTQTLTELCKDLGVSVEVEVTINGDPEDLIGSHVTLDVSTMQHWANPNKTINEVRHITAGWE